MSRARSGCASALMLMAPAQMRWVPEPVPVPAMGEVTVATIASAVSVGGELTQYRGVDRFSSATVYPRMTGYESLGVVVAQGAGVPLRHGDRVVGSYGHGTAAVVPADACCRCRRMCPTPLPRA